MEIAQLEFSDKTVRTVFQSGEGRMMQLSLRAEEGLEKHMTKFAVALVVLTGKVTFATQAESIALEPMQMVKVPALTEHEVKAVDDSIVLLVMIPNAVRASTVADDSDLQTAYTNPELREKIAPELLPFVDDHGRVLEALQGLKDGFSAVKAESALQLIGEELNRHFVYEEDILFPRLTKVLGGADVGPVPKLLGEHKKIRGLHETCSRLLEGFYDDDSVQAALDMQLQQLSRNLLQHIAKEDSHLFSMASRLLSPSDKEYIAREVQQRDREQSGVVD